MGDWGEEWRKRGGGVYCRLVDACTMYDGFSCTATGAGAEGSCDPSPREDATCLSTERGRGDRVHHSHPHTHTHITNALTYTPPLSPHTPSIATQLNNPSLPPIPSSHPLTEDTGTLTKWAPLHTHLTTLHTHLTSLHTTHTFTTHFHTPCTHTTKTCQQGPKIRRLSRISHCVRVMRGACAWLVVIPVVGRVCWVWVWCVW